jgi:uncharacterized protein involved in type VI secretion and phage assembly
MRPVRTVITLGDSPLGAKVLELELTEEAFAHQRLRLLMSHVHKPDQEDAIPDFSTLVGQSLRVELEDLTVPEDESTGSVLFFEGLVEQSALAYEPGELRLEVTATSGSTALDSLPRTKIFQETTLQGLIDELLADYQGDAIAAVNTHLGSLGNKRISFAAQWGETDWAFLLRLARKVGLFVAARNKDLHIHVADSWEAVTGQDSQIDLVLGQNLNRFRVALANADTRIRGYSYQHFGEGGIDEGRADQVEEVRIWTGPSEPPQPSSPLAQKATASTESEGVYVEPDDYFSQQEFNAIIGRWSRVRIAGMVSGSGESDAIGLGLGSVIFIAPAATREFAVLEGDRFLVTRCHHRVVDEDYSTEFEVCADGAPPLQDPTDTCGEPDARVISGIVTDACDPSNMGRVKVRLYPLNNADPAPEIFVRCTVDAAGEDHGTLDLPEVSDEVILSFDPRGFAAPVMLGSVYNGANKALVANLPSEFSLTTDMQTDNHIKYYRTKAGTLIIHDTSENAARLIIATPNASVILSEASPASIDIQVGGQACQITAVDDGSLTIKAKNISIETEEAIKIKSGTQTEIESGANLKATASGDIQMKADSNVKVEAGMNYEMKASMQVKEEASVTYEIKGGTNLKMQAVKIDLN